MTKILVAGGSSTSKAILKELESIDMVYPLGYDHKLAAKLKKKANREAKRREKRLAKLNTRK